MTINLSTVLTSAGGVLPVAQGGTGVSSSTGTGSNVLSSGPTFVAPALGTPSSGNGSNITNVNAATLGGATFAAPGPIGATTPAAGSFTTLSASGNILQPYPTVDNSIVIIGVADSTVDLYNAAPRGSLVLQASSYTVGGNAQGGGNLTLKAGDCYSSGDLGGHVYINTGINILTTSQQKIHLTVAGTERGLFSSTGLAVTGALSATGALTTAGLKEDASGNLGIGVTPSAWSGGLSQAIELNNGGHLVAWPYASLQVGSNCYYNGTTWIYSTARAAAYYRQSEGLHSWQSAPSGTAGTAITFTQVLSVEKDKSLALQGTVSQAGTGITFPATQSASTDPNTLDDYEEGTWTPSIGGTATYTTQNGTYTKAGRLIAFKGSIAINAIGTGSTYILSGLPFASDAGSITAITVSYFVSLAVPVVHIGGYIEASGSTMQFVSVNVASGSCNNGIGIFGSGADIRIAGTYNT